MENVFETDNDLKFSDTLLKDLPPTMAYVPMQFFRDLYDPDEALIRGTLFSEIDKPFKGKFVK